MRLSANTGFLFKDKPFVARIHAAAEAGFEAIEFHDEAQADDLDAVQVALEETGLTLCGINTFMGDIKGRAALPGQEAQALADFKAALVVADQLNAGAVHVCSGITDDAGALDVLRGNLERFLGMTDRTLLIEPISARAIPGYAMRRIEDAADLIDQIGAPHLKIMFDTFHVSAEGHDVGKAFAAYAPMVGHVQVASYPERGLPDAGVATHVPAFAAAGVDVLGCECVPPADAWDAARIRDGLGIG